jgi:hypothetical protein
MRQNPKDSAVDSRGNIYITGTTTGPIGGKAFSGGSDIFVIKVSSEGILLFTKVTGGSAYDYSHVIEMKNDYPYVWVSFSDYPSMPSDTKGAFWLISDLTEDIYAECRLT